MPQYCYRSGETLVVRPFKMGEAPPSIEVDGVRLIRSYTDEHYSGPAPGAWPMASDAAGVHPSQAREAEEHSRQIGVPTTFLPDGRAYFESAAHRKRYCEAVGLYDRNAGYGDPLPHERS